MTDQRLSDACLDNIFRVIAPVRANWTRDGERLVDDGVLAFAVVEHGFTDDVVHLDVVLLVNRDEPTQAVIIDYTSGHGATVEEQAATAIQGWAASTAPVIFELLEQRGEHATNLYAADPKGLHNWHVIQGPTVSRGSITDTERLGAWLEANPLLPLLETEILPAIAGVRLPTIRIMLGGNGETDLAEVQINGKIDNETSALLRALDWPRPTGVAFAKIFCIGVHDATD